MSASEPASTKTSDSAQVQHGKLRWLHLSDIHFWRKNDWRDDAARSKLITMLSEQFASGKLPKPDLIFCTGDIAQGETKPNELSDQYKSAKAFFNQILKVCGVKKQCLFVVPGNHDVNRNNVNEIFQDGLRGQKIAKVVDSWAKKDLVFSDAIKRMNEYGAFIKSYLPHQASKVDEKSRHCYCKTLSINGVRIGIAGFNSAWTCFDDKDQNQLWMAAEWQFNTAEKAFHKNTDLRIGLMHHPTSWLQSEEASLAKKRIRTGFHFWLHGHEHDTWVTPTDAEVMIAAGAVNAKNDSEFGINFVDLQLLEGKGWVHLFSYHTEENQWHIKPAHNAPLGVQEIRCQKFQLASARSEGQFELNSEIGVAAQASSLNSSATEGNAAESGNHTSVVDCTHPSQKAMQALAATIADALSMPEAQHFRAKLCQLLQSPVAASVAELTAKLDALALLETQMLSLQKALQDTAKYQAIKPNIDGEPHAVEKAAAALYMRAALRRANLAAIEAGCPYSAGLTVVPAHSEVLIAILAAAQHGEVQPLNLKAQAAPVNKVRGKAAGENFIDFADAPFYPLKAEEDITHALGMKIDKRYNYDVPPQSNADLAARQDEVRLEILQQQVLNQKYFRGIVSDQADIFLQDEARLCELHRKLGLPFTRVVSNAQVNVVDFLGVSLATIDRLFLQFLEELDKAKQPNRNKLDDA